jgi:hypothetical protein
MEAQIEQRVRTTSPQPLAAPPKAVRQLIPSTFARQA